MPLDFMLRENRSEIFAVLSGKVEPEMVMTRVRRGYLSGVITPGRSRTILVEENCFLGELTFDVLKQLRDTVLGFEAAGGVQPNFRAAIVDASPLHHGLLTLYKALWDDLRLPMVEVSVHETMANAELWHDRKACG